MEIRANGENKHLKYNHVAPIDLDIIPKEELEQALKEFAEGSVGLELCLRTMWQKGLKTHACCAAEDTDYNSAYIAMAPGVDAFCFLSDCLLESNFISLEELGQKQVFRFGGPRELREQTLFQLAHDIQTGKKNNPTKVQEKIGKSLDITWLMECDRYSMKKAGLSEEEIAFKERERELWKKIIEDPKELEEKLMEEYTEYVRAVNEKLLKKHEQSLIVQSEEQMKKGK